MLFEIEHCVLSCRKTKSRIFRFDPEIDTWPLAVSCFHSICAAICNGPLTLFGESETQKSPASGAFKATSSAAGCEDVLLNCFVSWYRPRTVSSFCFRCRLNAWIPKLSLL